MPHGTPTRFNADLPGMWAPENRAHAHRCLPVVLRVRGLPYPAQAQARRLLRILLLRLGALSARSGFRKILLQLSLRAGGKALIYGLRAISSTGAMRPRVKFSIMFRILVWAVAPMVSGNPIGAPPRAAFSFKPLKKLIAKS